MPGHLLRAFSADGKVLASGNKLFWAKPGDYRKATQRVYHAPKQGYEVLFTCPQPSDSLRLNIVVKRRAGA